MPYTVYYAFVSVLVHKGPTGEPGTNGSYGDIGVKVSYTYIGLHVIE